MSSNPYTSGRRAKPRAHLTSVMAQTLMVLAFQLLLAGCTGKDAGCGRSFLLPWANETGGYSLQTVELSTLANPYLMKGEAAEVRFEAALGANSLEGSIAEPHLTHSGGLCVPTDTASSVVVNAYAQFERLLIFERRLGTQNQLSWPRQVGVETHLIGDPIDVLNNAHYYDAQDAIAIVPYDLNGLPLAMNQGIVAHEHFHAHFQSQVMASVNAMVSAMPVQIQLSFGLSFNEFTNGLGRNSGRLNDFVLRGWNEGLADFFGGVYVGRPDFFESSLPDISNSRRLDGKLSRFEDEDRWRGEWAHAASAASGLNGESQARAAIAKVMVGIAYNQGTALARLMSKLAQSGVQAPQVFLSRVMARLKDVPAAVVPRYLSGPLPFETVVPILIKDFVPNAEACAALQAVVSYELIKKDFARCLHF